MMKKHNLFGTFLAATLVSSPTAFAAAVSYDHIGLGYESTSTKGSNIDPDGVKVHFSKSLGDSFYIKGQISQMSGDDNAVTKTKKDFLNSELGIGYHVGIFKSVDLYSDVTFIHQSVKSKFYKDTSTEKLSANDSGFAVELGTKMAFTHSINADLYMKRWQYDEAGVTEFGTRLRYAFENVDLIATIGSSKNQQTVGFGFQYKF